MHCLRKLSLSAESRAKQRHIRVHQVYSNVARSTSKFYIKALLTTILSVNTEEHETNDYEKFFNLQYKRDLLKRTPQGTKINYKSCNRICLGYLRS